MALVPIKITNLLTKNTIAYDLGDDDRISPNVFPLFQYPASSFALQTMRVLNAYGLENLNAPRVNKVLLPILMSKLPDELLDLVPISSVEAFLDFLLQYDGNKPSWFTFSQTSCKTMKPSISLNKAMSDMSAAWPGLGVDTYRKMSWDMVRSQLPDSIRYSFEVSSMGVPDIDQLRQIDDLWTAIHRDKQTINNLNFTRTTPAGSSIVPLSAELDQSTAARLSKLEKSISRLTDSVRSLSFSPAQNNKTQNHNNFRPAGFSQASPNGGYRSPVRPHENNSGYCYYHYHYGVKARNCIKPCNFAAMNSKQAGYTYRKPIPSSQPKN